MNSTHDGHKSQVGKPQLKVKKIGRAYDLTGLVFGFLTALNPTEKPPGKKTSAQFWKCVCKCGREKITRSTFLIGGNAVSCGHCKTDKWKESLAKRPGAHGMTRTWQYVTLRGIVQRCDDPNSPAYGYYGGRGITYDSRWKENPKNFFSDLEKLGPRPIGYSLDRIDTNNGYFLANLRWASKETQMQNRRSNINLTYNGKTQCVAEWARELRINRKTIVSRIESGWPVEEALAKRPRDWAPGYKKGERPVRGVEYNYNT